MRIECYKDVNYIDLHRALKLRGHPIPMISEMPKVGYMAVNGGDYPIAYGFLRMIEGGMAMIDGLATDPRVESGAVRYEALNMVFQALLDKAQALGITQLMGFSVNNTTLAISEAHGFVKLSHTTMTLNRKV